MTDEIKRLKKELKEWKSQEVKERFERVNSQLHLVTINELEHKIKNQYYEYLQQILPKRFPCKMH